MKAVVISEDELGRTLIRWFSVGVVLGAIVAAVVATMVWRPTKAEPVEDAIIKACRLPDENGAMSVFVMEDGKSKCWRWK